MLCLDTASARIVVFSHCICNRRLRRCGTATWGLMFSDLESLLKLVECSVSPRRLADIEGHDIFKNTESDTNSRRYRPISATKAAELAGTHDIIHGSTTMRSSGPGSARARKMDNLLSVAFTSGKEELPVRCVSPTKSRHLQGTYSFSCHEESRRCALHLEMEDCGVLLVHETD